MAKEFTKIQPKHGDRIIHCGHLEVEPIHFWKMASGKLKFRRPDGTFAEAEWIVCCEACFQASGGDPKKVLIRGDGTWKGDEPAVFRDIV